MDSAGALEALLRLDFPVDAVLTLGELPRGRSDPTVRLTGAVVWRASRTSAGPAAVRLVEATDGLRVSAWGPGASAAIEAVPRLLGADDDPAALVLPDGPLRDLARRFGGLRFGRTDAVWPALMAAICGQRVTSGEAHHAFHGLVGRYGDDAPGPASLRLVPRPEIVAGLSYAALHSLGLEQRRAVTLIRAAERAAWLEEAVTLPPGAALARLRSLPGIGPWTAAEVARQAFGDPDAVSLGDYHLPDLVCWALAGETRGNDARMLELLEPYRGQRARVVRLLECSGIRAPRFGPRTRPTRIDRL
jgi:3-methyladenine DNA glycosylase/8-oxoguanine DNA glycosylase